MIFLCFGTEIGTENHGFSLSVPNTDFLYRDNTTHFFEILCIYIYIYIYIYILGVSKLIVSTVHRDADEDDSVSVQ